jgi:beta-N-acetylhexosaminidase
VKAMLLALPLALALAGCTSAQAHPAPGPAAPRPSANWVGETLASLTLRERVAQLVMPWVGAEYTAIDSPEFDRLREWVEVDRVGGLILSVGLPHSYAAKLNALQARAAVPLLVASDMENGTGMRLAGIYSFPHLLPQGGGTVFPPVMALGAIGSDTLAYELGRVLGREARAVGVHVTFGPVLDVNSNPRNPIINTRSFGEDPALVSRLGTAYIRGARAEGLMTTGKHFPGHGDTDVDSHIALPTIGADRARLDALELRPFRAAVAAGIDGIMTAHIAVVGVEGRDAPPATLSPYFMTRLLREEMGFEGVLYTDALDMGGVTTRYGPGEAAVLALEAGADVLLMPLDVRETIDAVVAAVESGRLSAARVDDAARRVLGAKVSAGLPERRLVSLEAVDRVVGVRAHTGVAREVAERSITLARDARNLVPSSLAGREVLSITYADPGDLIAGRHFNRALTAAGARVTTVRVDERTTGAELERLRASVGTGQLVLVSAYVSPREHRGSVDTRGAFASWVETMAAGGAPLVVLSFGSPYLLADFPSVPAYLLAWGGAEVSQRAAARALLGEIPITGRLPISLPPYHAAGEGLQRAARTGVFR